MYQDSYHKNNAQDSTIKLRTMDILKNEHYRMYYVLFTNCIPCIKSNIMIQPDSELTHQIQSVKTPCCEQ